MRKEPASSSPSVIGQLDLFGAAAVPTATADVLPAEPDGEWARLAVRLPPEVRLGTSSWSFPGWRGLVYRGEYAQNRLAREGLSAYAQHPLLRTVGVDRSFYDPLEQVEWDAYRRAVPPHFRFVAKAHEHLTFARFPVHARYGALRGEDNPRFLDPGYAAEAVVRPFLEGLAALAGPLVFQFPPQDWRRLGGAAGLAARLAAFFGALPRGPLYAVELRNRELYCPAVAEALDSADVIPVLAGWGHLPPLAEQATALLAFRRRALVVRWMLPPGLEYEEARAAYAPFNRLVDEDPETRGEIARLAARAARQGMPAYVTINNKAEGCAPLSAVRLAEAIVREG